MATDFNVCGFGAITPELILRSLIGCITGTGVKVFRIEGYTNVATTPATACASYEDFMINLQRAMDMADDGQVTLRMNMLSAADGGCGCNEAATWYDNLNSLFGVGVDGKVYINVVITNPS